MAEDARATAGAMGLRRFHVHTVVREWSGPNIGDGGSFDLETELLEAGYPPKVRALTGEELALNGLGATTYEVGPFTPSYTDGLETGGVTYSTLVPECKGGVRELFYRISGDEFGELGKLFARVGEPGVKNFRYILRLQPVEGLD
jgi:hypothetical protein